MNQNPYQSPEAPIEAEAVGVVSGRREDLRAVAKYQRGLMLCILAYLIAVVVSIVGPQAVKPIGGVAALAASLVGVAFVFLLSTKVYSTGLGILFGILTLIPIIGLLVLLVINSKATGVLRRNRIKVGLLGANPADV